MYDSVFFSIFKLLCNHRCYLIPEHFLHPKKKVINICIHSQPLCPSPPNHHLWSSQIYLSCTFHRNGFQKRSLRGHDRWLTPELNPWEGRLLTPPLSLGYIFRPLFLTWSPLTLTERSAVERGFCMASWLMSRTGQWGASHPLLCPWNEHSPCLSHRSSCPNDTALG